MFFLLSFSCTWWETGAFVWRRLAHFAFRAWFRGRGGGPIRKRVLLRATDARPRACRARRRIHAAEIAQQAGRVRVGRGSPPPLHPTGRQRLADPARGTCTPRVYAIKIELLSDREDDGDDDVAARTLRCGRTQRRRSCRVEVPSTPPRFHPVRTNWVTRSETPTTHA